MISYALNMCAVGVRVCVCVNGSAAAVSKHPCPSFLKVRLARSQGCSEGTLCPAAHQQQEAVMSQM